MARLPLCLYVLYVLMITLACRQSEEPKAPPPPPEITVVEAKQEDVPVYEEFLGQTYGEFDIAIRARVEGFLESMHFVEGSRVAKGQLLYIVDPQPFETQVAEAQSKVAEAQTRLVKAESDLNRIRPLAEQNAVSQSDLDAAEAQFGAAQASLEAAKSSLELEKIRLSYTEIRAPISGLIGKTEAKVGDFVGREPNPVVLNTISQIETILVRFAIPEADYLRISRQYRNNKKEIEQVSNNNGNRRLELILADGSVHEYDGEVNFAEREVDPSTGTLLVQASFPNPQRLIRPGQYGRVRALTEFINNAVIVPRRCIIELQGQFSVYKVDDENRVIRQTISGLINIGDFTVVEEGIEAGDRIVIDAIQKVAPDLEVVPKLITFESKTDLD